MANLQTPFPLEPARDYARVELCNMLDMTIDDKLLVIDPKLTGILGLIADSATLSVRSLPAHSLLVLHFGLSLSSHHARGNRSGLAP